MRQAIVTSSSTTLHEGRDRTVQYHKVPPNNFPPFFYRILPNVTGIYPSSLISLNFYLYTLIIASRANMKKGCQHIIINSIDRMRGSTSLSRFSEETSRFYCRRESCQQLNGAESLTRANQRATATEILLVEMFYHSQSIC
ncbi:hypothetical protein SETIT_4G062200v2 [Setaria italica]|uniref:Uncharacterized protein n=2 Tax=Setaria TaxID=4554 RepID=A0A368QRW7_SETIT|nr:hypothetical protein SETIT_4G062200v2 [Setaria italica]TKW20057.1 hypothetical protein SEVIR_4G060300v2 [Setaria viridis]